MDSHETTEHFSLRWNNYHNNLSTGFHSLLQAEDLVDVTLAAEGNFIQAHKIVLSICSPYFKALFKMNPCQHPIVILKDVSMKELTAILEFMYKGEVSVNQEDLTLFLKTAEMLQIKGLTGDDNTEEKNDVCHPTTPPKRTKLVNKPNKSIGSQRKTPKLDIVDTVKVSEKNQNNESSTKRIEEPVAISPNENIISNNCELTNRLHGPVLESTKIEPIDFDEDDDPMDDDLDDFDDSNMHSYSKTGLNLDESSVSQSYSLAKSASDIFLLSEQPSESTSNSLPDPHFTTCRGKSRLWLRGYQFCKNRTFNTRVYWVCLKARQHCQAKCTTINDVIVNLKDTHNHAPPTYKSDIGSYHGQSPYLKNI